MAEQLSNLEYKPWMKGNFNSLQIQGVNVSAGGSENPYFSPNIITSAYLNPPYSEYFLTYNPLYQNGFLIDIINKKNIICVNSGVYNIFLILNQSYASGGSGRWDYNVNVINTTSAQTITSNFVGGDPQDAKDDVIRTTFNCVMAMSAGDIINIKLQQNIGSSGVNAITVQGSDSINKPTLLITKLGN